MTTPYDDGNIFAKIILGEIPCEKVYEDDAVIAFMDVMPQAEGHVLVVPKKPSRNLLDAADDVLGPLFAVVRRLARAAKSAFNADGVMIMQFNEKAAGQSVFHLHVHVIPRKMGTALKPSGGRVEDRAVLAAHAAAIRSALD